MGARACRNRAYAGPMPADTVPLPPVGNPGRRHSPALLVVLALALLVTAAALADTVVRARTEASIARQVTDQQQGRGVEVRLEGWPFLWQVGRDHLEGATLRADSLVIDADGLPVEVVDVDLAGGDLVGVRDGQGIVAGRVDGSVGVSWQTLGRLSGLDLAYAGPDRVRLSTSFGALGRQVPVTVEGTPRFDPTTGGLGLGEATADVAGATIPARLVDLLLEQVGDGYRLPPLGTLAYDSLDVGPEAVRIGLVGTDVDVDQVLG